MCPHVRACLACFCFFQGFTPHCLNRVSTFGVLNCSAAGVGEVFSFQPRSDQGEHHPIPISLLIQSHIYIYTLYGVYYGVFIFLQHYLFFGFGVGNMNLSYFFFRVKSKNDAWWLVLSENVRLAFAFRTTLFRDCQVPFRENHRGRCIQYIHTWKGKNSEAAWGLTLPSVILAFGFLVLFGYNSNQIARLPFRTTWLIGVPYHRRLKTQCKKE